MGDIAPHFDRSEFACPGGAHTPVDVGLAGRLEVLRGLVGSPCIVVSGYRTPEHNQAVGGAPQSLHLWGMAADLPAGWASQQQATQAGFTGIGLNAAGQVVHVDVREGSPVVFRDPAH